MKLSNYEGKNEMLTEQEICEVVLANIKGLPVEELQMFIKVKDEGENRGSNFWYDLEWHAELTGSASVLSMLEQVQDEWGGVSMPTTEDLFLLDKLNECPMQINIVSRDAKGSCEFSTFVEFCGAWAEFQG